jgi:hypothetical protein
MPECIIKNKFARKISQMHDGRAPARFWRCFHLMVCYFSSAQTEYLKTTSKPDGSEENIHTQKSQS